MTRKWIVLVGYIYGSLALALAITWLLLWQVQWSLLRAYLVAINVVTYLVYVLDKIISQEPVLESLMIRVPELVLHSLALAGGTPGALAAMLSARHKIGKDLFVLVHLWIWISQIALAAAYQVYR